MDDPTHRRIAVANADEHPCKRRLLAEAVEKVRTIKFCATIVRVSRACGNVDSTKSRTLNHCFKIFDPRDFFDSLSHERTFEEFNRMASVGQEELFTLTSRNVSFRIGKQPLAELILQCCL